MRLTSRRTGLSAETRTLKDDLPMISGSDSGIESNDTPILDPTTSTVGAASPIPTLSPRDIKILQLVAAGHASKEIDQTLDRSAATIRAASCASAASWAPATGRG